MVHGNGLVTTSYYNQATGTLDHLRTGLSWQPLRELEYEYDANSNVARRSDVTNDIHETFEYDPLDRLTRSSVSSNSQVAPSYNNSVSYDYDLSGNINYKSDVGYYEYDNLKPYVLVSAGDRHSNYRYDANGNVTSGTDRTFSWSSFNKPTAMSKAGASAQFSYDPDRSRYKRTDNLDGTTTNTWYLGKAYERIETGNHTTHKYFIYAGKQLVAIHFDEVDTEGDQSDFQTRYPHADALGSIDLITDGLGQIVDKMNFDPFGKRRTAFWRAAQTDPLSLAPKITNRGFTGHEHVDAVGIIHMNGRIYDPELGRFLSADPTMQHPYRSQGYNRYAYVQNNPLKYTDPSGFTTTSTSESWGSRAWSAFTSGVTAIGNAINNYVIQPTIRAVKAVYNAGAGAVGSIASAIAPLSRRRTQAAQGTQGSLSSDIQQSANAVDPSVPEGPGKWGDSKNMVAGNGNAGVLDALGYVNGEKPQSDAQKDFSESSVLPGEHYYSRDRAICTVGVNGCSEAAVARGMHENGSYPDQTESLVGLEGSSRTSNVSMFGDDHIQTFVGSKSIVNATYPDHFLHPGFVIRSVFTVDSTVHIRTEGGGWGWLGGLNNGLKDRVWEPVDQNVIKRFK